MKRKQLHKLQADCRRRTRMYRFVWRFNLKAQNRQQRRAAHHHDDKLRRDKRLGEPAKVPKATMVSAVRGPLDRHGRQTYLPAR